MHKLWAILCRLYLKNTLISGPRVKITWLWRKVKRKCGQIRLRSFAIFALKCLRNSEKCLRRSIQIFPEHNHSRSLWRFFRLTKISSEHAQSEKAYKGQITKAADASHFNNTTKFSIPRAVAKPHAALPTHPLNKTDPRILQTDSHVGNNYMYVYGFSRVFFDVGRSGRYGIRLPVNKSQSPKTKNFGMSREFFQVNLFIDEIYME